MTKPQGSTHFHPLSTFILPIHMHHPRPPLKTTDQDPTIITTRASPCHCPLAGRDTGLPSLKTQLSDPMIGVCLARVVCTLLSTATRAPQLVGEESQIELVAVAHLREIIVPKPHTLVQRTERHLERRGCIVQSAAVRVQQLLHPQ